MTASIAARGVHVELVDETVRVGGRELSILRPRDADALLDEDAFEHEEFLPYWAELWPSALALAEAVSRESLQERSVLELGCGLAVPSIVAALAGAHAAATDWSPDAIALAQRNAARNGAPIETTVSSWIDRDEFAGGPWDLVLASDVLYERRNVALLLDLLPALVDDGDVLLADPGRPPAAAFLEAASRRWHIRTVRETPAPRVAVRRLRKRA